MWMPYSPPVASLENAISTQSPMLARMTRGWMASSPCRPSETFCVRSWARTSSIRFVSVNILPCGSLSPKRLSGIFTSSDVTSKRLVGEVAGQGAPAPAPAVAISAAPWAKMKTGATRTRATPAWKAWRWRAFSERQRATCGSAQGSRRSRATATKAQSGSVTASESSVSRIRCSA